MFQSHSNLICGATGIREKKKFQKKNQEINKQTKKKKQENK